MKVSLYWLVLHSFAQSTGQLRTLDDQAEPADTIDWAQDGLNRVDDEQERHGLNVRLVLIDNPRQQSGSVLRDPSRRGRWLARSIRFETCRAVATRAF
jgi:hypothetical protein